MQHSLARAAIPLLAHHPQLSAPRRGSLRPLIDSRTRLLIAHHLHTTKAATTAAARTVIY